MNITVILCTYNRCQSLAKALASAAALRVPESVEWEVLVVDNNSSIRPAKLSRSSPIDIQAVSAIYLSHSQASLMRSTPEFEKLAERYWRSSMTTSRLNRPGSRT